MCDFVQILPSVPEGNRRLAEVVAVETQAGELSADLKEERHTTVNPGQTPYSYCIAGIQEPGDSDMLLLG